MIGGDERVVVDASVTGLDPVSWTRGYGQSSFNESRPPPPELPLAVHVIESGMGRPFNATDRLMRQTGQMLMLAASAYAARQREGA